MLLLLLIAAVAFQRSITAATQNLPGPLRIAISVGPVYSHYVQFTKIAEGLTDLGHSVLVRRVLALLSTYWTWPEKKDVDAVY